jgi:L-ascorbate metabolism protein UlaG (beta-lactamase superfamily)
MEITWYGHSCFRLTERGLASVVADPYDHASIGYQPLKLRADIVTVSHDAPGHTHTSAVKGKYRLINGPGEYEIGGVFITAVQTDGRGKRSSNGPRNILYVYDYSGVAVAHLGHIQRVPSQTEIEALGHVSVALVPVGGGNGITAAKAAEVVSMLEPGIVIPMHFSTPESKLELASVDKFLKEMGVGEIESQPSLKVTRTSVPKEARVVLLDYKKS